MKVNIKKDGKVKEYSIISNWGDVTLESWLGLVNHTNKAKGTEALETIAELSDIPKKLIKQLELKDVALIMKKIGEMQSDEKTTLRKIITIEDKEYGFHPDLDSITLGEYSDLEHFIKAGIEKHLPQIMSILYRPITSKEGESYNIEAYDGNIRKRSEEMKKMSSEQVQGALLFFYHFAQIFVMSTQSSLTVRLKQMKMQLPQMLLQKNGVGSE
tara:strand:+ start:660 stop:1301 length:642 start_codon:yes stop_codon:yes gene_type:complete